MATPKAFYVVDERRSFGKFAPWLSEFKVTIMKKYGWVAATLAVAITAFWSAPSNALTFNFSFDSGAVSGEIDGLYANGTNKSATHVIIITNTSPISLGTLPSDLVLDTVFNNSFNVDASGQVTLMQFLVEGPTWTLCLTLLHAITNTCSNAWSAELVQYPNSSVVSATDLVITPATTPLPASLPLFATGLGALGLLGWRRKRKAGAMV